MAGEIKGKTIDQLVELVDADVSGSEWVPIRKDGVTVKFRLKLKPTKADVGLDRVDNTPDSEKPISQLQQQALDQKAAVDHEHSIEQVSGLQNALDGKASRIHNHQTSDVEGLPEALNGLNTGLNQAFQAINEIEEGAVIVGSNQW